MSFTDLFIKRPILSITLSILILLTGLASLYSLPMRQYPAMESATITVTTQLPGATQEVIQGFITSPIAQSLASARGIEYLTSTSTIGKSEIRAKLVLNADSDKALTEVMARVQQVKYRMPKATSDPVINVITDGVSAVQYLNFSSDVHTIPEITDYISRVAQPLLTSVPGVASVEVFGGQTYAMRLWLDPHKMAARNVTASDISNALRANNVQSAPGLLRDEQTVMPISATTDLRSVHDFREMIVKRDDNSVVYVKDVATVELGGQSANTSFFGNGERVATLAVTPTPDGNPLEIVSGVNKLLPQLQSSAPPGLIIDNIFDSARFVNAAIDEVMKTLLEAVLIVVVVIFLFLGTFRAVIIPIVTIPLSLVGAAILMMMFGFSLNLLTLLAMVLAIGLVVDDAIVVVENIHRHIEEGQSPVTASLLGAREIIWPVIGMTVTLAAVYAPIGLMGGITGALFKEFAFTLACAVIVSGVIALTLSPMMSSYMLNANMSQGKLPKAIERLMIGLANRYGRVLGYVLHAKLAVVIACFAIFAGIIVLFLGVEHELAPSEDQGYVFVQTKAPQYASVSYTERTSAEVENIFRELPDYHSSFFGNGDGGQNSAFGGVVLKSWEDRDMSSDAVEARLNQRALNVTGAFATAFQPAPLPAGSGGLPVQMIIRAPVEFSELYKTTDTLKEAAWGSGLFAFVDSNLAFDSPQAKVNINSTKASEMGVSMYEISETLAILIGENYVNRFNWFDRSYDVITQVAQSKRQKPNDLEGYYVRSQSGDMVPLSTLVNVSVESQANRLPQFNQMNAITLSAVLLPGVTMGQAVEFLKSQPLPRGTQVDWMSDSRQFIHEGNRLIVSFGFALIVIFLVLAAQYESFRDPLVILVTVPLAICGALVPLWLGYATMNIYTQIGLVTLIGLISKHGILMVSFANEIQKEEGLEPMYAILKAAMIRMRPILMTTAAMVSGLIPLMFASGAGAESRYSIGVVVVTGLLVGTFFTLFVLPAIYTLLARDHRLSSISEREKELAASGIAG